MTLAAQPESQWIAVDVSGEKPLAIWRRKEGPQWNRMRLDELRVAVESVCQRQAAESQRSNTIAIDPVATRDKHCFKRQLRSHWDT